MRKIYTTFAPTEESALTKRNITISGFLIGSLGIVAIFAQIPNSDKSLLNFISLYGSYTSIYGLIVAYFQILSIKDTAKLTNDAVEKSNQKIDNLLSVSDLSKAIKIIQEIQIFLRASSFEAATLRMTDLKFLIIQVQHIADLNSLTQTVEYRKAVSDITIDLINISNYILDPKKKINIATINSNLENTATVFIAFENRLKYNSHDK